MSLNTKTKQGLVHGLLNSSRALLVGAGILAGSFAAFHPAAAQADMVLNRGNGSEPATLDPQLAEGVPSSHILRDMYEGLVAEDASGKVVPGQAESWTVSKDGLTYKFKIRDDANWTNGKPVTAGDFVYAWRRAVDPKTASTYAFLLAPIKNAAEITEGKMKPEELGVKAIDDKTLEVDLSGPTPYFLGMLTHSVATPVYKPTIEANGDQWTRPGNVVSNGAFKMTEWTPQSRIVLEKNDKYWDAKDVKLDKVIYYPTEDQTAELKRFRAGELDWTYEVPNDQIKWIRANMADDFVVSNYLGTYYYGFNMTKPPFDNAKLRKAFSLAINREILMDKIVTAGEVPAYEFVVPGINGYTTASVDFKDMSQKERNAEAYKLYQEAGYSKDKPLTVELRYNTNDNHKKIAIAIASMWKSVLGANVRLVNEEWKVFLQNRKAKEVTQVFRAGWIGDYNDPNTFLDLWKSDSGQNDTGFNSPKYDKLIEDAANEQDPAKRMELLHNAEQIFVDANAVAPIYHYVTKHMIQPYVKGWDADGKGHVNVMDHVRSQYLWIAKH